MKSSQNATAGREALEGKWVLDYVASPGVYFDSLYKEKIPEINFNLAENKFNGNSGCNSFTGKLNADSNQISFKDPIVMTKMFCPGDGEKIFEENLKKVNRFSVNDGTLNLIAGDIAVMRFMKQDKK